MIIEIPFKTPSVNHLYGQHGKIKYLKPEAKRLRESIKHIIDTSIFPEWMYNNKLSIYVYIYENWLCKDDSVKRKDVSNREKFLIDSIFDALKIDDKMIFKHTMQKIQSNEEKVIVEIEIYE